MDHTLFFSLLRLVVIIGSSVMSFNRLMYDTCNYKQNLQESVSTLGYVLDNARYEHKQKCRHNLGLVGGSAVSHVAGNLVDLESELRGQTRYQSKCPCNQYMPASDGMIRNDKTAPIDTTMKHLPSCQMIGYRSIPLPTTRDLRACPK